MLNQKNESNNLCRMGIIKKSKVLNQKNKSNNLCRMGIIKKSKVLKQKNNWWQIDQGENTLAFNFHEHYTDPTLRLQQNFHHFTWFANLFIKRTNHFESFTFPSHLNYKILFWCMLTIWRKSDRWRPILLKFLKV